MLFLLSHTHALSLSLFLSRARARSLSLFLSLTHTTYRFADIATNFLEREIGVYGDSLVAASADDVPATWRKRTTCHCGSVSLPFVDQSATHVPQPHTVV